jgi:hypothetical protein
MNFNRTPAALAGVLFQAGVLLLAGPPAADAQEKPPSPEQMAEIHGIMMNAMSPGPEHELLEALVGDWSTEVTMWPEPGADPMTMTGSAKNRMVLGGRFLVSEAESGEGELKSSSLTIFGFDRRSGDYTTVSFDTWGTYSVSAAGKVRAADGTIVMHGEDSVAGTDHTQTYDFVLRRTGDDTHVFEIVFTDPAHTRGGPPFKMVEITYRRTGQ